MTNVTYNFFYVFFIFITLYVFRAHRAHHQERQIVSIKPLVVVTLCRWLYSVQVERPANDTATGTGWQLPEVVLTQFVSPDDEHDVLETCRELKIKIHRKELCVTLVIYQKSLHDARSTKYNFFLKNESLFSETEIRPTQF